MRGPEEGGERGLLLSYDLTSLPENAQRLRLPIWYERSRYGDTGDPTKKRDFTDLDFEHLVSLASSD